MDSLSDTFDYCLKNWAADGIINNWAESIYRISESLLEK